MIGKNLFNHSDTQIKNTQEQVYNYESKITQKKIQQIVFNLQQQKWFNSPKEKFIDLKNFQFENDQEVDIIEQEDNYQINEGSDYKIYREDVYINQENDYQKIDIDEENDYYEEKTSYLKTDRAISQNSELSKNLNVKFSRNFIIFNFLIFGLFLVIAVPLFWRYNYLSRECQKIIEQIGQEMDINQSFCKFKISKISLQRDLESTIDNFLLPNLKQVQQAKKDYLQRKLNFEKTKKELELKQQIASIFFTEEDFKKDAHLSLEKDKNNYLLVTTNLYQEQIEKLDLKLQELQTKFTKDRENLAFKLEELKELNLQNTEAESFYQEKFTQSLETLEEAEKVKEWSSKLKTINQDLDEQIKQERQRLEELEKQKLKNINSQLPANLVRLPILMYHRIEEYEKLAENLKSNIRKDLTVTPENFIKQLDFLQAKGYQTVTMADIEEAVLQKDKEFFNRKLVMLTFDDGYKEHYEIVFPELRKRNMKGVFGVYIKSKEISIDQLREMQANGMEIVSHSVSHCMLGSNQSKEILNPRNGKYQACSNQNYGFTGYPLIPTEEVRYELRESKKTLETWLNTEIRYYIHTYGVYNATVLNILKEEGYTLALSVGGGPNINLNTPLTLHRVNVSGHNPALGGWFETIH